MCQSRGTRNSQKPQFSDATSSTQNKHSNVTTSGSAVWDRALHSLLTQYDGTHANHCAATVRPENSLNTSDTGRNLPAFATLTNDEDRERKAGTTLPGTYSVVVTPESFAELPEYAIGSGERSPTGTRHIARSGSNSSNRTRSDPNVVVLDRFEDLSPSTSLTSPLAPQIRQVGLPETLQHMSLTVPPHSSTSSQASTPVTYISAAESRLVSHFRRYIVTRLVPKNIEDNYGIGSPPIRDIFENEAARFPPVRGFTPLFDHADSHQAPPRYMCTECAQSQLSRPSDSRRSNRTLRSGSLGANAYFVGQRPFIRRSVPATLPPVHL
jgi:hypothetical protein